MKATGITRRIDDLGRIVLPKELRKTLGIEPGTEETVTLLKAICNGLPFVFAVRQKFRNNDA